MNISHAGELAALVTAISWTVSATLFDQVSKSRHFCGQLHQSFVRTDFHQYIFLFQGREYHTGISFRIRMAMAFIIRAGGIYHRRPIPFPGFYYDRRAGFHGRLRTGADNDRNSRLPHLRWKTLRLRSRRDDSNTNRNNNGGYVAPLTAVSL